MDSEDELWLEKQKEQLDNLTPLKFEEIMDRLEKSSSQHVISIKEAKMLLKEDEDVIIAVFDYWLNKRLRTQMPLIPQVRTERRDMAPGNSSNNPYIAFRRRTEKMQTRKNRKNDEISYEKMLKLRRDLSRAKDLLALVRQREKTKIEHLKSTMEIFEKRYAQSCTSYIFIIFVKLNLKFRLKDSTYFLFATTTKYFKYYVVFLLN